MGAFFDPRTAERIGRAARLVERADRSALNRTPPTVLGVAGEARPIWVVKVTGPAEADESAGMPNPNRGLYPAVGRRLSHTPPTSPSSPEMSSTPVSFSWGDDTDVIDCWAAPIGSGTLTAGDEGLAVLVSHTEPSDVDEGKPIFTLEGGGSTLHPYAVKGADHSSATTLRGSGAGSPPDELGTWQESVVQLSNVTGKLLVLVHYSAFMMPFHPGGAIFMSPTPNSKFATWKLDIELLCNGSPSSSSIWKPITSTFQSVCCAHVQLIPVYFASPQGYVNTPQFNPGSGAGCLAGVVTVTGESPVPELSVVWRLHYGTTPNAGAAIPSSNYLLYLDRPRPAVELFPISGAGYRLDPEGQAPGPTGTWIDI